MLTHEQAFPNRIAGVIRCNNAQRAFHACMAAVDGGIGTLEVTTGVPDWAEVIRGLIASSGRPVGVGTVMLAEQVVKAEEAGAAFVVTPLVIPEVARAAREQDILCVMGALTPTEIHQALSVHGADIVKIFPIAAVGGAAYLRMVSGPLPGLPVWVSGGVELDQVAEYLSLGVKAVGLTTALFPPDAVDRRDTAAITALARQAVSALAPVG